MAESMSFPNTFDEFAERYKIVDKKEVYTNGIALIPIFRVKQWLEHQADVEEVVRCEKCRYYESLRNGKKGICRHPRLKTYIKNNTDFCSHGGRKLVTGTNVGSK